MRDYALCCILIVLIAVHLTVEALNTFYLLYFPPPPLSLSLTLSLLGGGGVGVGAYEYYLIN